MHTIKTHTTGFAFHISAPSQYEKENAKHPNANACKILSMPGNTTESGNGSFERDESIKIESATTIDIQRIQ